MVYSHTQISQYLRCPRSYRYRYLDGWREKETRASLLFGRAFEKALAAFFSGEDSAAALFKEWGAYRDAQLEYSHGDDWERMARQGVQLLERLAQHDRIGIREPQRDMQVKLVRSISEGSEFVSYDTSRRRSATNNDGSMAAWLKPPSARSRPASSCRTAASASRKTAA